MATISITIPNARVPGLYDAMKAAYGHDVESPTGAEMLEFLKLHAVQYFREIYHAHAVNEYTKNKPAADDTVAA